MESKKNEPRGVPLAQHKLWNYSIAKEDQLRLKWFQKNEQRLEEIANQDNIRQVPKQTKNELDTRILNNLGGDGQTVKKIEIIPPLVDPAAINNIMRPIEKEIKDLIYTNVINEGRITYLNERIKLIPEKRYYFPETTNFQYGWNMWDITKEMGGSPHARKCVIRDSFYRRSNVDWDEKGAKQPARLSPQVCGQI